MREVVYTFFIAGFGVLVFILLALPLPWLLGPIAFCLLAALSGIPLNETQQLDEGMRTILGVAVGATLTPAVLVSLPAMWPTLVIVPMSVLLIGFTGIPYFRKVCGYDFPTAYYATMPGGLPEMIAFGQEKGANVRALGLIHATRMLIIVVTLPFLLAFLWDADLSNPPGKLTSTLPFSDIVIMILCAFVGWKGAKRLGMFGASILGPLIVTAGVTLAGGLQNRPPAEAIWAAQFFIGMSIGSKYVGITWEELRRDFLAGLGFCGLLMILVLITVETIYALGLASGREALLSFAPGGQADLVVFALIVGADVAFVAAHHIVRLFVVILGAPIVAKFIFSKHAN